MPTPTTTINRAVSEQVAQYGYKLLDPAAGSGSPATLPASWGAIRFYTTSPPALDDRALLHSNNAGTCPAAPCSIPAATWIAQVGVGSGSAYAYDRD